MIGPLLTAVVFLMLPAGAHASAQETSAPQDADAVAKEDHPDTRTQYPAFLANSYFSVDVGYIDYAFSARQLEPGVQAGAIAVRHIAARVAVFGHEFNRFLSVQCTYMRPVRYVTYSNVNGDEAGHGQSLHLSGFHGGGRGVRRKEERHGRREDQSLFERQYLHAQRRAQDSADAQRRICVLTCPR